MESVKHECRVKTIANVLKSKDTKPVLKKAKHGALNIVTLNVCGLKSSGRIDQVRHLLLKYQISIAVLTTN